MTVYFKPEHFKTSVPVAITSMLVMYTLNQSISAKLPPTSYIKFIDVWLLFGLIQPFFIIIMLVLNEHIPRERIQVFSAKTNKAEPSRLFGYVRIIARFILPVVEILFTLVYSFVALIFYNEY